MLWRSWLPQFAINIPSTSRIRPISVEDGGPGSYPPRLSLSPSRMYRVRGIDILIVNTSYRTVLEAVIGIPARIMCIAGNADNGCITLSAGLCIATICALQEYWSTEHSFHYVSRTTQTQQSVIHVRKPVTCLFRYLRSHAMTQAPGSLSRGGIPCIPSHKARCTLSSLCV
ncbi:hypothetical protein NEOLEDRAFT_339006 [Neolentinus lepideus HHB14362 ss-1]|uniref:Uncharacterized protein n=1 Tax=Neolentinus lepideus HHB14362 ss-1 TaxID=1314782 RepID=A0A165SVZ8_9AGAM|nr:hypothetical protein NEOLEDRAFT_339006 [Neolentinus lepideus HHB14362 ss-1]